MNTRPSSTQEFVLSLLPPLSTKPHHGLVLNPSAFARSHAMEKRFIGTKWELIPTPALKSSALCTAAEAAPKASIPVSHLSSWDLEMTFPARPESCLEVFWLQEELANRKCLILSARFHFQGAGEKDTRRSLWKPFSFWCGYRYQYSDTRSPETVSAYTEISDIDYFM